METWKLLAGAAGALVIFAVVVSVGAPDAPPWVLVGSLVIVLIGLYMTVRSYRLGQEIGTRMREKEDQ